MTTVDDTVLQAVCPVGELPVGTAVRVDLGVPVAVFNVEGELHAIDDTCTHQDASLSEGWVEDCAVECPLHAACFDLRTGRTFDGPTNEGVRVHSVVVLDGVVHVARAT